jgi:hypothetical protein
LLIPLDKPIYYNFARRLGDKSIILRKKIKNKDSYKKSWKKWPNLLASPSTPCVAYG